MFINANPRIVSNGFESFVPIQRTESLHQRLVEMTNNDVNAWSIFRPVASSMTDNWDQHIDEFSSNENYPIHTLYGGNFQDTSSVAQSQPLSAPKITPYTAIQQGAYQLNKRPSVSRPIYHESLSNMNGFEKPSPMLGNDYAQGSLGRGRGSFAEFSSGRSGAKDFSYQSSTSNDSNDIDFTPFTSTLPLALPRSSYQENSSTTSDCLNLEKTTPSTAYSGYSTSTTSVDPLSLVGLDAPETSTANKYSWWSDNSLGNSDQYQNIYGLPVTNHGLPRMQNDPQQQYCDLWNGGCEPANPWAAQPVEPSTISPKALTLNVSSAPLSSSGSSQGAMLSFSASNTVSIVGEDVSDISGPETLAVVEPQLPIRRTRQILPDSMPAARRIVPVLPSSDFPPSKNTRKRPMKTKSGGIPRIKTTPPFSSAAITQGSSYKADPIPQKPSAPKRIEAKPTKDVVRPSQSWMSSSQSAATAQAMHHRDEKDDFLVKSKLAGMSYKDIRRQGKFTEAESTLRGRFRTLTKHKTARVRKPEWNDNDIRLLKKAVRKLTMGSDPCKGRVPWKQVAEYIANNGGSYHFGNATCRKRWDELHE